MTTFASDTFNGATNGETLSTYDAAWTQHASYARAAQIVSSGGGGSGQVRTSANGETVYYKGTPSGADYSVTASIYVESTNGSTGACARLSTANKSHYLLAYTAGSNVWRLFRLSTVGFFTQIGSSTVESLSAGAARSARIDVSGTGATVTITTEVNGVGVCGSPNTDTSGSRITTAGVPGFYMNPGVTPGDAVAIQLDAWQADEAGGGGGIPVFYIYHLRQMAQ